MNVLLYGIALIRQGCMELIAFKLKKSKIVTYIEPIVLQGMKKLE